MNEYFEGHGTNTAWYAAVTGATGMQTYDNMPKSCVAPIRGVEAGLDRQSIHEFMHNAYEFIKSPEEEDHDNAIKENRQYFYAAGFGDYAVDFSDVKPEIIRMLGGALREYFEKQKVEGRYDDVS